MNEILKKIGDIGLVPIVTIDDASDAVSMAQALSQGGLPIAEITFRTDAAEEAIERIAAEQPEILLGAGTILNVEQARRAMSAGARFIVSPGFNPDVVEYCVSNDITIMPGCSSPSDIEKALGVGLDVVKFFPAEALGGLKTLKAVSAPYGMIQFVPTGGIHTDNFCEYLRFDRVLACGGSWMVSSDLIRQGKFQEISRLASEAVRRMLGFSLVSIGINTESPVESEEIAGNLSRILNLTLYKPGDAVPAGPVGDVPGSQPNSRPGRLIFETSDMRRAVAYLHRLGLQTESRSEQTAVGQAWTAVFLDKDFGGFSVCLVGKE